MSPTTPNTMDFFQLPPEIRAIILRFALSIDIRLPYRSPCWPSFQKLSDQCGFLFVSKQAYIEGAPIFYSTSTFHVTPGPNTGLERLDKLSTKNVFHRRHFAWELSPYDVDLESFEDALDLQRYEYLASDQQVSYALESALDGIWPAKLLEIMMWNRQMIDMGGQGAEEIDDRYLRSEGFADDIIKMV